MHERNRKPRDKTPARSRSGPLAGRARPLPQAGGGSRKPRSSAEAKPVSPSAGLTAALLEHMTVVLEDLLTFRQPADVVLSTYFRQQRQLGGRERAWVAETCYAVLRHLRQLQKRVSPAHGAHWLVLAALVRYLGIAPKALAPLLNSAEQEWLLAHKAAVEPEFTLAERLDFPDWLVLRLQQAGWQEDGLMALARSLNQSAPLDVRVNVMKATREAALERLHAAGLSATPCPWSPWGLRLVGKPALQTQALFLQGWLEVQDEGSQLLGALVAPRRGEMVVDFCAGAGGKTLLLGAMMRSTGRLYAFDVSDKRLAKLKPRLARSGLSNVHPVCIDNEHDIRIKRLAGKIDRVLVDAPCSGLGTLRRNPDLKWRQTPDGLAELGQKQRSILASAARLLKPGGRLVYATCSLLDEENHRVVDEFLAGHPEFVRLSATQVLAQQGVVLPSADETRPAVASAAEDLHLYPHRHATDGFYAAVLERRRT